MERGKLVTVERTVTAVGLWARGPICADFDEDCGEMTPEQRRVCARPVEMDPPDGICPYMEEK